MESKNPVFFTFLYIIIFIFVSFKLVLHMRDLKVGRVGHVIVGHTKVFSFQRYFEKGNFWYSYIHNSQVVRPLDYG